jgi:hypothetical protein
MPGERELPGWSLSDNGELDLYVDSDDRLSGNRGINE